MKAVSMSVWSVLGVLCVLCCTACVCAAEGEQRRYSVSSTVVVGDRERRGAERGYRIAAHLAVTWRPQRLHFTLEGAQLLVRGKESDADYEVVRSVWDAHTTTTFEAELHDTLITHVYLDPTDHQYILNYKKALVSLFQIQAGSGTYNETDISGECEVTYETLRDGDVRKIKRSCARDGGASALRITRYTGGAAPTRIYADELVTVGAPPAALRARVLHQLEPADRPPVNVTPASGLRPHALPLEVAGAPAPAPPLTTALNDHRAALEGDAPGEGGDVATAAALARLLPSLQAASRADLLRLLDRDDLLPVRAGLCRALGVAGTAAAATAVRTALRLAAADAPLAPARHYLQGLALALQPHADAVEAALTLAREARSPLVSEAALLAAAAAAPRAPPVQDAVRGHITERLARCEDDACRALCARALGNMRDARDLPALMALAEGGGRAAPAALTALGESPGPLGSVLERLAALAVNESAPFEVRAAALEVAVSRGVGRDEVVPVHLAPVAAGLAAQRSPAAAELRRLLWQRLEALSARPGVAMLLQGLTARARGWAARATGGSSSALRREPGWAGGGWSARLDSVQVALGGALRRGRVALTAQHEGGVEAPLLAVEVHARGLDALAGGGGEEGEEDGPAAELALEAGGAALPEVALFAGQAELLGHVWAGTGAEDTAVVRGAWALRGAEGAVALAGGVALRWRTDASAAVALDARGSVSLWRRTAEARLALRGAGWARTEATVDAWGGWAAEVEVGGAPRLALSAAVDAWEGRVCVRADAAPHAVEWRGAARGGRAARGARWALAAEGRTLSLGRDNDASCRTLRFDDE